MKILLAGGFSGGHIIPLIRLEDYLKTKDDSLSFTYIGFKGYLEEKIAKENNIDFIPVIRKKGKYSFYFDSNIYKSICKLNLNFDALITTGGGHSFHILKYCKNNKIPYYIIEENTKMGLVNWLYSFKAQTIYSPFNFKRKNYLKAIHPSALVIKKELPLKYDYLFLGGSLGSDPIAKIAIKMRNMPYKSALLCGNKYDKYKKYQNKNLDVLPYQKLDDLYDMSDLVITRAGASTLFELLAKKKKMIIIPSKKTRGNHQVLNAIYFQENDLAYYLDEKDVSIDNIIELSKQSFSLIFKAQEKFILSLPINPYEEIIKRTPKK